MEVFLNLYVLEEDYRVFIKSVGRCKITEDMGVVYTEFVKLVNREDVYKYDINGSIYVIRLEQFSPIPKTKIKLQGGHYEYL